MMLMMLSEGCSLLDLFLAEQRRGARGNLRDPAAAKPSVQGQREDAQEKAVPGHHHHVEGAGQPFAVDGGDRENQRGER